MEVWESRRKDREEEEKRRGGVCLCEGDGDLSERNELR